MQEYKEIENKKYVIRRVFTGNKTTSMLIEQSVINKKNNIAALTGNSELMYNKDGGSIQFKEVLWESNKKA